jgi:GDP/UDP-N,N'-diacetylbacillosamine 2-epimerase (hydrolysing)
MGIYYWQTVEKVVQKELSIKVGGLAMKIGVLTSSRADFGIYLPLLKKLRADQDIDLQNIAFGTHCSNAHGKTVQEIYDSGFNKVDTVASLITDDTEEAIATAYGLTVIKFADYWATHEFDLVFCLGDRFEMSAAVQAGIPFGTNFVHLHGGEITLGAIDNVYRHQITVASKYHFTSTQQYAKKVKKLIGNEENVYNVGSLSLDGIEDIQLVDEVVLRKEFEIPEGDFILSTFHPETIQAAHNKVYVKEMAKALKHLAEKHAIVVTMPNADTLGSIYRKELHNLEQALPDKIVTVESFGKLNYFSAIKYASLVLGNSSSGIIEAASFKKYVVNVGDRQKGRAQSDNVINCAFKAKKMVSSVVEAEELGTYKGDNIYYQEDVADRIIEKVKDLT